MTQKKVKRPTTKPKPKTLVLKENKVISISSTQGRVKKETKLSRSWPLRKSFISKEE